MKEIEKGMYVRTRYGIAKVEGFFDAFGISAFYIDRDIMDCYDEDWENYCRVDDIIGEPSFDIMDLIEEGDYVNGHKISCITEERIYTEDDQLTYEKQSIKTILTKEQYEMMCYEVKK